MTYSGSWTTAKEQKQIKLLENWIAENRLTTIGNYMVAAYNGPYVPPILRRNEVMVRVVSSL